MIDVNILAKFWGGSGLLICLIFLIRWKESLSLFKTMLKDENIAFILGYLTMIIGVASLSIYAKWTTDWKIIVTIFGWATLIKGVRFLLFPNALGNIMDSDAFKALLRNLLLLMAVLCAYLLYMGIYS